MMKKFGRKTGKVSLYMVFCVMFSIILGENTLIQKKKKKKEKNLIKLVQRLHVLTRLFRAQITYYVLAF